MARRFGRRKRPGVLWLPTYGHGGTGELGQRTTGIIGVVDLQSPGIDDEIQWDAFALTFDYTDSAGVEQSLQERSLQDLVAGNEWRLRRIVGKVHAAWRPRGDETNPLQQFLIEYGAGFIVCKTDDDGNPVTDFGSTNPLAQDSQEDPWIWRRKWLLSTIPGYTTWYNQFAINPTNWDVNDAFYASHFPSSTAGYHSVADGPHVDQKTARVIHRQERLFFVHAARVHQLTGGGSPINAPGQVMCILDYRLLGSLRRASAGNRRNASR